MEVAGNYSAFAQGQKGACLGGVLVPDASSCQDHDFSIFVSDFRIGLKLCIINLYWEPLVVFVLALKKCHFVVFFTNNCNIAT